MSRSNAVILSPKIITTVFLTPLLLSSCIRLENIEFFIAYIRFENWSFLYDTKDFCRTFQSGFVLFSDASSSLENNAITCICMCTTGFSSFLFNIRIISATNTRVFMRVFKRFLGEIFQYLGENIARMWHLYTPQKDTHRTRERRINLVGEERIYLFRDGREEQLFFSVFFVGGDREVRRYLFHSCASEIEFEWSQILVWSEYGDESVD